MTYIRKVREPQLMMTTTEELFMPVRLYYIINDKKSFVKALKRLKCVLFNEDDDNHFIISYYKEAKKMGLSVSYQEVPEDLYPITLADGYIISNTQLHIDIKSLRRVPGIIDLLVKGMKPTNTIKINAIANVNKATFLGADEDHDKWLNKNYGELFDHVSVTDENMELLQLEQEIRELEEGNFEEDDEKLAKFNNQLALMKQQEIDHYPDVEKMMVDYNRSDHEDFIAMLNFKFNIKEIVAQRRYDGDQHFTTFDAIGEFSKMIEEKILAHEASFLEEDVSEKLSIGSVAKFSH